MKQLMTEWRNFLKEEMKVVIGAAKPKSDVEWAIYRSKHLPSPQDYGNPHAFREPDGGRFSTAFPLSTLDLVKIRSSEMPAPCDYPVSDFMDNLRWAVR